MAGAHCVAETNSRESPAVQRAMAAAPEERPVRPIRRPNDFIKRREVGLQFGM